MWAGGAQATSICELDIVTFDFTNTGVCGQVITTLDGVQFQDLDESGSVASASAQQGASPPAAGSDGTSGTASATYPNPDGTGGSVGAAASVSGGSGSMTEISSLSGAFFIGEFIADDGLPGNDPFDLTVNLGIEGELFVQNDGIAGLAVLFAAVDSTGATLGEFVGIAPLQNIGPVSVFFPLGFTQPFDQDLSCIDVVASPHECTVTADFTESLVLPGLVDGDLFGLFLTIEVLAVLADGVADGAAHANFDNTVELSFEGGNVRALPANFAVPEPASIVLVVMGALVLGVARGRRRL